MKKIWILLFVLLLSLGCLMGYLYLTEKINAGNIKIAEGKKQIEEGEKMLSTGKGKLAKGKRQLSHLSRANSIFQAIPFMKVVTQIPVAGGALNMPNQIVAEGHQQVVAGEKKVKSGEQQLAEGKLELQHGIKKLYQANIIRVACGISALIFFCIFLSLLIYWRKSLAKAVIQKT